MARKKFEEGFKENAIEYCQIHSEKTIKACAAELGIGYSTLRRWISQSEAPAQEESVEEVASIDVEADSQEKILQEAFVHGDEEQEALIVADDKDLSHSCGVDNEQASVEAELISEEIDFEDAIEMQAEAVKEDLDDEFDWVNKRDQMKSQLGELIETAGSGMSDAVQLLGLYKKRHALKKVQKKLKKEKEKRFKL